MSKAPDPSSKVFSSQGFPSDWSNDPLNYAVKAFVAFLQSIWEIAPRGYFHWTPSMEETEIVITEENPVFVDSLEKKPVISVVLGPTRFNGSSLDDLMSVNFKNASEKHTDLLPGTATLNCMSRVGSEARFIGWHCARTIWNLRKIFITEACFHEVGRNIQIGSVTPAGALVEGDTEGEWHSVAVSVPFFLQWMDQVTPVTNWDGSPIHTLQHIETNFKLRLNPALTSTQVLGQDSRQTLMQGRPAWGQMATDADVNKPALRPATIRGRAIKVEPPQPVSPVEFQKAKV